MIHKYKKTPTNRQLKISEMIKREISITLAKREVFLPVLETILFTVVDVKTSSDLKISTVFINFIDKQVNFNSINILNALSTQYRQKICKKITLRFVPKIRFMTTE